MSTNETSKNTNNENDKLVEIISAAVQIPGVKVNRAEFLLTQFKDATAELREEVLAKGPVEAGYSRDLLKQKASHLLMDRTLASTGASFLAGLPGGLAMAATIPADMLQYYAVALRTAQEIAYLYGEADLWSNGSVDDEKIRNQLILYCGVMFGASGAAQAVRVLSSALAKQALKKIPQPALTKTIYYPIIKSICKFFGIHMTKGVFAKGVSKAVPVIGGFISGGITFATMRPMGMRLINAMDEARFAYSQADFNADWIEIVDVCEENGEEVPEEIENITQASTATESTPSITEEIKKAKELFDLGIISEEEFTVMKNKLIAKL